jgi:hypothetical protein
MKPIKLSEIRIDGGTQTRAAIDQEAVNEYAEAVHDGAKFPPVDIFYDGASNWLADGFHRYHAHKKAGVLDILATIHEGTIDEALQFALGANRANGLRRTNKDKRNCVKIALAKWPEWSDRRIAEVCGVGHPFVGKMRPTVESDSTSPTTRIDIRGNERPANQPPRQSVPEEPISQPAPNGEPEPYPVYVPPLSQESIAAGEAAAKDSEKLWLLKSTWRKATKKDRATFLKWAQNN